MFVVGYMIDYQHLKNSDYFIKFVVKQKFAFLHQHLNFTT